MRVIRVEAEEEEEIPPHTHDADEVVYVIRGALRLRVEDREIELLRGKAFLIPKGSRHLGSLSEGTELLVVYHP